MIILGIDPGYAIVGYGVIRYEGSHFQVLSYGAITTDAGMDFSNRLGCIHKDLNTIIEKFKPDCVAMEKLFFNTNTTTAIGVAEARGCLMLSVNIAGLPIFEYTPLQIKQSVTGYGRAEKKQVMEMTRMLLNLEKVPRPDDAADALAVAVCHAHSAKTL